MKRCVSLSSTCHVSAWFSTMRVGIRMTVPQHMAATIDLWYVNPSHASGNFNSRPTLDDCLS